MPSYERDTRHASGSASSRHDPWTSSADRRSEDHRSRPRSPRTRHRSPQRDHDRHYSSESKRDHRDRHREHSSSHRSAYGQDRWRSNRERSPHASSQRDHHDYTFTPSSSSDHRRHSSNYEHRDSHRRPRSPDTKRRPDIDARPYDDERGSRASHYSRHDHGYDAPRRHDDDYRRPRRPDRSRSRSRDRSQRSDARDHHRPSTSHPASHPAAEAGEIVEAEIYSKRDNHAARPPEADLATPPQPRPPHKSASRRDLPLASEVDEDEDRLETLARASVASHPANGVHSTQSRDPPTARPSDLRLDHDRTPQINGQSLPHREDRHGRTSRGSPSPITSSKSLRQDPTPPVSADRSRPESAAVAHIAPPPTRAPPPASSPTFGHVPLPHELDAEQRSKNAMTSAPLDKKGNYVQGKYPLKTAADKRVLDAKVIDPRKGPKRVQYYREALHRSRFIWDANSVGTKPLPPPRNLVITGLPALTQPHQILPQIRPFGRISSSKLEVHPAIGQSLGIFCVTFAHDFDEHGEASKDLADGQAPQNGAKVAKAAQLALNGRQFGQHRIVTLLDRAGEVLAEQVKLKIAADQAKHRPPPSVAASATPAPARPSQSTMPPPDKPRASRPPLDAAPSSQPPDPSPAAHSGPDRYDARSPRWASSKTHSRADVAPRWDRHSSSADSYGRRRDEDERDSHPTRPHSSLRPEGSRNASSANGAQAALPKRPTAEILDMLRGTRRPYVFIPKPKSCNVATQEIKEQLASTPPRWIIEGDEGWYLAYSTKAEAAACKIVNDTLTIGGYTLQVNVRDPPGAAPPPARAAEPTNKTFNAAAAASSATRTAPAAPAEPLRKSLDSGLRPLTAEEKQKTQWTEPELQDAVFRMLQKELADGLLRDVKSRIVVPHLTSYLKPDGEGFQLLAKTVIKKPAFFVSKTLDRDSSMDKADKEARLPSFRKVATAKTDNAASERDAAASKAKSKHDQERTKKQRDPASKSKDRRTKDDADDSEDIDDLTPSKRSGECARPKSGVKKRGAAAWLLDSTDEEAESDDAASTGLDATSRSVSASVEPSQNETDTADAKSKKKSAVKAGTAVRKKGTTAAKKSSKSAGLATPEDSGEGTATPEADAGQAKAKPKAAAKAKPIPADPFEAGLVEDAEDLYFLRLALDQLRNGELPTDESWPEEDEPEVAAELEGAPEAPAPHLTGSAKTEGMYRIAPAHKAAHLPDRNKATEETDAGANAQVLQSARNNRADSRRLVLGIEQHKRETATDTDMFKFNQLRTRKKQLKFAKSPIHDWGLYAMELIPAGDMVIEYVGEVVRQQVADEREKQYERQGNFSTYLFRVDDDLVVDATHKGNIARLMNHCCTPNCNAKILTLNGEKRIVLFAKSPIRPGEELTYDYKFQSSADDEDAIPCLCGSPGCRRFL